MNSDVSRREFLARAALAGLGAAIPPRSEAGNNMNLKQLAYPSSASARLIDLLGISLPIVQAPAGGTVSSDMVAAVSNSGGLGGIPLSWSPPDKAMEMIRSVRRKTSQPYFVNFVLHFEPAALEPALDAGAPIVQFSWGMPDRQMVAAIRSAGAVMGIQVTSGASAKRALDCGADYLVCQGTEAGGHVHASRPLARALEEVLGVAGEVPVLASGGIASGHTVYRYMAMGAAGAVMGSCFVASLESAAHEQYKQALVQATSADTVFTTCMNKGWDNATHRILRNSTYEMWESAGCPATGTRPGETDAIAWHASDPTLGVERYSINSPGARYDGDVEAMAAYAGMSVDDITELASVEEIFARIRAEYQAASKTTNPASAKAAPHRGAA
jgi:nitronate monooxygenase